MTLILLGHEISRIEVQEKHFFEHSIAGDRGLFAIADSALTIKSKSNDGRDNYRTLLTGLSKVHELKVQVRRPDIFRNGHFQGTFPETAYEGTAFLAFAGNANSAHHALNGIRSDLGDLRLSYRFDRQAGEPKGNIIIRRGDSNPMHDARVLFDEDTFYGPEVERLFTADFFAAVVATSIQEALQSVVEHCHNDSDLGRAMATFAFGVWCPVDHEHKLYHLQPTRVLEDGRCRLIAAPRQVPEREVLALGTASVIRTLPIQATYDAALAGSISPAKALTQLMDRTIDQEHAAFSGFPINRPIARYHLKQNFLRQL